MKRAVGLLLLVLLAWPPAAPAAVLTLGNAEKAAALHHGESSLTREEGFDDEWLVRNADGERVLVITPFFRLAQAARNAAFKNEPMKPDEPDKILKAQGERVLFWAYLHGDAPDFDRYYTALLVVGDHEVKPAWVQNERSPIRQPDGRFLARCVYAFPSQDVTPTSKVELIVKKTGGGDVTRFTIDLARMR